MPTLHSNTFRKEERLCSKKLIDTLFCGGGSKSLAAFPLRAVYLETETPREGAKTIRVEAKESCEETKDVCVEAKNDSDSIVASGGKAAESFHPQVQILVSVPKKHFKRAVKRNRVKRQVREAYRKNKAILLDKLSETPDKHILLAFIWLADELYDTAEIETKVCNLLQRIAERI